MDGLPLLNRVAEAYRNLTSLAVEQRIITEMGDERHGNRGEQEIKAYYRGPDHYRHETCGWHPHINVVKGLDYVDYHAGLNHFRKGTNHPLARTKGTFSPEFPSAPSYLFPTIGERVVRAEWLRDETGRHIVLVEYEPFPQMMMSTGPVEFWIDTATLLVWRYVVSTTTRRPAHDERRTQRYTIETIRMQVNHAITDQVFELEIPEGAVEQTPHSRPGLGMGGGGSGSTQTRPDGSIFENWHSQSWAGETLIHQSKLRMQGLHLELERRLTLSEDKQTIEIEDSFIAPDGAITKWTQSIKLTT